MRVLRALPASSSHCFGGRARGKSPAGIIDIRAAVIAVVVRVGPSSSSRVDRRIRRCVARRRTNHAGRASPPSVGKRPSLRFHPLTLIITGELNPRPVPFLCQIVFPCWT